MADGKQWEPKMRKPKWQKIDEINPNIKRRNLIVKVVAVNDVDEQAFKEVVVGDDTGIITSRFHPDQLSHAKIGNWLRMQNARIGMFKGHIRVEVDKWGKLADHEKQDWEVNKSHDVSSTEFELVSSWVARVDHFNKVRRNVHRIIASWTYLTFTRGTEPILLCRNVPKISWLILPA